MLSSVEHWLVSAAVVIALLVVLFACICGCRKKVPKNELLGLAGMVKITNPEENLDQNYHQENGSSAINDNNRSCVDTAEAHRRTLPSTANRSLPDLPVDRPEERLPLGGGAGAAWEPTEPHSDAGSALYATVTENKEAAQLLAAAGELAAAADRQASDKGSDYSSLSQADDAFSPYAQLKGEHPYDRLRTSEHPYAQVGVARRPRSSAPAAVGRASPVAPPRQRKANSFHAEAPAPIAAATAVAGRVSANQELPYMTPPIVPAAVAQRDGQHFSGDSQDSSKGYTSISVREPLANIKAQSQQRQRRPIGDEVYTTVSDDSEEVYADIEDAQGLYASGSETYAQILPPPETDPGVAAATGVSAEGAAAPPPPSVDSLKHLAQAHSRQASSSSAASSVANLGSPKPEKRQANSPLPPPPPAGPAPADLYATVDKKGAGAASGASLGPGERSLDEMYAKVMKRSLRGDGVASRQASTESEPGAEPAVDGQSQSSAESEADAHHPYRPLAEAEPVAAGYAAEARLSAADPSYEEVNRSLGPNYEEVLRSAGPNYEEVNRSIDPNYEEVNRSIDPNYEEVNRPIDPNYEEVNRPIDPNYEEVNRPIDPNYEEVHRSIGPNYEEVHKSLDPNYEEVNSFDPNYEEVHRSTDPNYEDVHSPPDPSYASVQLSSADPNYEELRPQAQRSPANSEPGYATVGQTGATLGARSLAGPNVSQSEAKNRPQSLAGPNVGQSEAKNRSQSVAGPNVGQSEAKIQTQSLAGPSVSQSEAKLRAQSLAGPNIGQSEAKLRAQSLAGPSNERAQAKVRAKSVVEPSYAKIDKSRRRKSAADRETAELSSDPPYERLTNSRDSIDEGGGASGDEGWDSARHKLI